MRTRCSSRSRSGSFPLVEPKGLASHFVFFLPKAAKGRAFCGMLLTPKVVLAIGCLFLSFPIDISGTFLLPQFQVVTLLSLPQ
eukprot:6217550-Ditylum_brightwellii.AAC.1